MSLIRHAILALFQGLANQAQAQELRDCETNCERLEKTVWDLAEQIARQKALAHKLMQARRKDTPHG